MADTKETKNKKYEEDLLLKKESRLKKIAEARTERLKDVPDSELDARLDALTKREEQVIKRKEALLQEKTRRNK